MPFVAFTLKVGTNRSKSFDFEHVLQTSRLHWVHEIIPFENLPQ